MTANPLVSICIPTYNGAQYIEKCIESCLAQTYHNLEIIICDDCSSDQTIELINKYLDKDVRIKLFQNTANKGLVQNWNSTLNHSNGEYIKWLFQDDWIELNAIEEFIDVAKKGYDFIISKRNFILDNSTSNKDKDYYKNEVKSLEQHFPTKDEGHYFSPQEIVNLAVNNIALNFIAEPSLIFFKKSLINKVGLYDHLLNQICDLEYNLRLAVEVGIFIINKPLCSFAIHANSTTNSNISKKYFQLRFIEQSYYAYKLIRHSDFKEFQNSLTFSQKIKLIIYYKYRMHEAKKFVLKNGNLEDYKIIDLNYPFLKPTIFDKTFFVPIFMSIDLLKSRL